MKTILTSIFLFLHLVCISQDSLIEFKKNLMQQLLEFENLTAVRQNLHYINVNFFRKLIDFIDEEISKKMFGSTTEIFSCTIAIHQVDTTVKFFYYYQSKDFFENYFKNCHPVSDKKKYIDNLIIGTCTEIIDLVAIDTIANVIITKPIKSNYYLYRSICPGGLSKEETIKNFKDRIFGQYQLIIWKIQKKIIVYFIAPPSPDSKLRFKHITGHF